MGVDSHDRLGLETASFRSVFRTTGIVAWELFLVSSGVRLSGVFSRFMR